ncbi:hypothetical protein HY373_01510 [Candidatus Berkelbacteria bacterium]|nr:hypothetical protein [Candidatus Berkelbacteria bacterium]MBI2588413.1 hypothetical protein [Candidatus Berkelbacteria bacterium]MBI4029835.1 hypothetical protein [Candidatus Berkelbacteria bacterium]
MNFPYFKIPALDPNRKWISRPVIPIRIYGPIDNIAIDALIDSGADISLFNLEIGKRLGLDFSDSQIENFLGIGGDGIAAYIYEIEVKILGMPNSIKIKAGFADSPNVIAILGQEDFFDAYRIKFEKYRNIIEINPVSRR